MLESLVSSKIRRALLEHFLTHPHDRFYLRGLAKELSLSVSPLRRELKRFEHSGLLHVQHEANILFYTINLRSPIVHQLTPLMMSNPSSLNIPNFSEGSAGTLKPEMETERDRFSVQQPDRIENAKIHTSSRSASAHSPSPARLSTVISVGFAVIGILVILSMGISSIPWMAQQWGLKTARPPLRVQTQSAVVAPVTPSAPTSKVMRGSRWRLTPGNFGGFSSH